MLIILIKYYKIRDVPEPFGEIGKGGFTMDKGIAVFLASEPASWFVVLLGIVIVFIGLVAIILLCEFMNYIYDKVVQGKTPKAEKVSASTEAPAAPLAIPNREEFIAAVSAALAEEMGEDISAIRILSVKKL